MFDAAALATLLEQTHGFVDVTCQLIKGTVRDTYLVTTGDHRYILCIYRHGARTADEILAELDVIDHLHADGLLVPPAIPDRQGQRLLRLAAPEGERYAVVFTYIEGQQLSKTPDPATMTRLGETVARMHVASDQLPNPLSRPTIDFDTLISWSLSAFESAAPHRVDDVAFLRDVADHLRPRLAGLSTTKLHYGLVHGDLIPSNVQITPDDQPALLDFDFCGYGWWLYDLATLRVEVDYWNMGEAVWQAFLTGYQAVRPLTGDDFANIPLLQVARQIFSLGIPAYHINTWGQVYFADVIVDKKLHLIRQAMAGMDSGESAGS